MKWTVLLKRDLDSIGFGYIRIQVVMNEAGIPNTVR
jgi:hypothetical protein